MALSVLLCVIDHEAAMMLYVALVYYASALRAARFTNSAYHIHDSIYSQKL